MGKYAKRQVIGAGSIPPLPDFHRAHDDAGQQGDRLFSTATQQERVSGWGTITKENQLAWRSKDAKLHANVSGIDPHPCRIFIVP